MVAVEVNGEALIDLQAGFFEADKGAAVWEQFRFERAPTGPGLGVIAGITRPVINSQYLGFFDACRAS